ncbi:MAG: hypothetical protein PHP62_04050 [Candidatus Moranbacteria bacterium]|nr:hypothetical protein [Candidatus Moranbacteria bacterium]
MPKLKKKIVVKSEKSIKPRCGLCGKGGKNLVKTDCCDNWICNDEDKYVIFSYARNSCSRNHDRFTLCAYHKIEGHKGNWKTCKKCIDSFEPEIAAWYGTNEYNFEKMENPPSFEPTLCSKCKSVIVLSEGGYSSLCGVNYCENCEMTDKERKKIIADYKKKND